MEFTQEEKEKWQQESQWYFKCPCGHDAIPFVKDYFFYKNVEPTKPYNITKQELDDIISKAYKRYEEHSAQYVTGREYVQRDLFLAMHARNPLVCYMANWDYAKKTLGHTTKWCDDKYYRMAEAICIYGMIERDEINRYVYEK